MSEKFTPPKPKSFTAAVKDFCAPIGQPSWTRDKLDAGAEKLNSCLRAAGDTLDNAFQKIDTALANDPKLLEKVTYGAMFAGLMVVDVEAVKGVMNLIETNAPVQGLSFTETALGFGGMMLYLNAQIMLGRAAVGLPVIKTNETHVYG